MSSSPPSPEQIRIALEHQLVSLAELIDGDNSFTAFPKGCLRHARHEQTLARFPLGVYRLQDILILGAHGLIATADNLILREQNAETHIEKSLGIVSRHVKAESPALASAVSLVSAASYNFYHWVIDSLPKVTLAEACGFQGSYLVPAPGVNPIVQESLTLLGIDASRIVPMEYPMLTVRELWVPTHFHGHLMEDTPELHSAYRDQMLAGASKISVPARQKLYVKRNVTRKIRFVVNADELEALLSTFDFEVFEMERMTLREQVALAAQASCLLGPHGAGILHSLWMPKGSSVIEILPSCFPSEVMSVHSRLLGHKYLPYVVPATGPTMQMEVDCEQLAQALANASR